ncbi:MAG: tetratricopeptide repeat protein [Nannocystaceae bacterium]|nr:tetratricopeptide repeat protein [Nannocystaceae bacterium]
MQMLDHEAQAPDAPAVLPCPLPGRHSREPAELTEFRANAADERAFHRLRRQYRDSEDWRSLATLLLLHAAATETATAEQRSKAAELCVQAYELWLERVKDRDEAAHALARALQLRPDNLRAHERLRKLYELMGAHKELVELLRWRVQTLPAGADAAALHFELAELLEQHFLAIGEAVQHYARVVELDPNHAKACDRLIRLYLVAGAWRPAAAQLVQELAKLEGSSDRVRVAELHRRLASIESEQFDDVPSAARHLQAALKVVPDDIEALRAFGVLYLASGKATEDGVAKAADIFYKAAELARRRGDKPRALKLLRRSLMLAPDHQQASAALENTLIDAEDWLALDELYREWLFHFSGADAVTLQLRRAELLDRRLYRREEARALFEEASRYQRPDDESWRRLEQIYADSGDHWALVGLLDAQIERMPDEVPTETLLRAAMVCRDELGDEERAAVYFYKVLEREPFNAGAFEGYKEHWRRKHNWTHLRDLILYQIEQAAAYPEGESPYDARAFAEEFVELADICERRLGDIDGALDAWGRLQAAYPDDARPAKHIARIEKRARMWDNMVRVQEAELERTVDPAKRLDILKRLTQVYRDRQVNPERAIELYGEILQLSPSDIQATRALTALHDRAGDYERVVDMLRDQHDRSRSGTERIAILRRMAELWHHELSQLEHAEWACRQILEISADDREASYRLQQLLEEQGRYSELLEVLAHELPSAGSPDAKAKLLRRMARIAELDLADEDRAASLWTELLELRPGNLEIVDKLVLAYAKAGRNEELGTLLTKAAGSPKTPLVRQIDYLLRLGQLAEAALDDPMLARTSFERVLRSRPDHRGALEALVRIYRREDAWQPLVAVLGKLQELAETEDDAFRIAWERAEILAEQLDDPNGAAELLESLGEDLALGRREVASSLLELYERAGLHRKLVRQAELLLLAAESAEERRRLYGTISNTWLQHLGDKQAAVATYARFVHEFSTDLEGLATMARLQHDVGDHEAALVTLQRRLDLLSEVSARTATLEQMATIAERDLEQPARALAFLRQALAIDHFDARIVSRVHELAAKAGLWRELLAIHEERFGYLGEAGLAGAQVDLCLEASRLAQAKCLDAPLAFEWAERGYLAALRSDLTLAAPGKHLRSLAEAHGCWRELLEAFDHEIAALERRESTDALVARLREAAGVALSRLGDAAKAIGYLQRAHRAAPLDEALADELERTAREHGAWQAVIELHGGRLGRAASDLGRYDACRAIARIYEDELHDPEKAFEWLRQAWQDLRKTDTNLADDAFEQILQVSERHRLWAMLCDLHLERARNASAGEATIAALESAAQIFDERLQDPLAAIRVLAHGLDEAGGDVLLPDIRRLSLSVDERRDGDLPPVGALVLLQLLQRLVGRSRDRDRTIALLAERAEIRELRLGDRAAAMAEWMRVLRLDPDDERAIAELERLADEGDLWQLYLMVPAAALEVAPQPVDQAQLLIRIAQLYEGSLGRPEYALRARLCAWRTRPSLPAADGDVGDEHAAIWRLAEHTGGYHTPPVPRDPMLTPTLAPPEIADAAAWIGAGLEPRLVETMPSPHAPRVEIAAPTRVGGPHTQEILLDDPDSVSAAAPAPTAARPDLAPPISVDPESLDFEDLEVDELEELDDGAELPTVDPTVAVMQAQLLQLQRADNTRASAVVVTAPPPPPRAPDQGLPALPKLTRPVLPARPRVASAWEEVALAYTEMPADSKLAKVEVALSLARLWEEGAHNLERAFQALERALLWVPRHEEALERLEGLAARHGVMERLLQAYELLLAESAMPEHVVAHNLRIAELHAAAEHWDEAESRYRAVLAVAPHHTGAMRALLDIYRGLEQHAQWAGVWSDLLEVEAPDLDADERIARTLELCHVFEQRLARPREAIERLELLARELPDRRELHDELARLLMSQRQWQQAIEALRVAADHVPDEDYRLAVLAQIADIYEHKLSLPDRAIAAWLELTELREDPVALARLQELYLATGRFEPALPIIEQRLAACDPADGETRTSLLVAKARALQEGGGDPDAATATLEELVRTAPDNDEVALALSRLYRRQGRRDDGVTLLRGHLERAAAGDEARHVRVATALAEVLDREDHDPKGALAVIAAALAQRPGVAALLRAQAKLARAVHDEALLVESLAALPDSDGLLEAADLLRARLHDNARALRLYSRVLAEAKVAADDPESPRRLASALEGLVRLRVDDGDIAGAMEFMDRQLAEMKGPTIRAQLLAEMGRITYRSTGDIAAARVRFDAALAEDPEYARAKLGLGEMLAEAGRHEEAEALLEQAVDALGLGGDPVQLAGGLLALAQVLEQSSRHADAHRRLTLAARHDPANLDIRAALVRNRVLAGRHREALMAADQLEERLAEGFERTPKQVRLLSDVFAFVAESALALKQVEEALARYRRAALLDPSNPNALEPLIGLCQERGALVEAAEAAARLAREVGDPRARGQKFIDAGMLFNDAAAALADGGDPQGPQTEAELRRAAFENIRLGLELLEEHNVAALDRTQLEVAFRATAVHDPTIALRCLDRLLLQPDLGRERRHDLLLEGSEIALAQPERAELAERFARQARELLPNSSAAVLALARVLEANGREDEIEPLVESFFAALGRRTRGTDVAPRIALLLRLAEIQRMRPEKAIAALELALELDPHALGPAERRTLAALYDAAGTQGERVLANFVEVLTVDPLDIRALAFMAAHHAELGDLDRAWALYGVLQLAAPEHTAAAAFFDGVELTSVPAGEFVPASVVPALPADGGVGEALLALQDGGAALLAEQLPRLEIPPEARVSPLGEGLLAQCWGEVLKRLGNSKVALVARHALPETLPGLDDGPEFEPGALLEVRCQQPPVILAHEAAFAIDDPAVLRFALARALHGTRPEALFAMGLRRGRFAQLLSALLQAFHPRHGRRKHHARDDDATRLSQELLRKLPMRTARQLGSLFKDHENEPFDSSQWRAWVRRAGSRIGLAIAGDLGAAICVVTGAKTPLTGAELLARAEVDDDLRDLIGFATSGAYAGVRRTLGYAARERA